MEKKSWYSIPYWDRLAIAKLNPTPISASGVEHLRAHQIDKCHYLLSQLVISDGRYVCYEYLLVTIYGYVDRDHFHYKTYKPLIKVWFE